MCSLQTFFYVAVHYHIHIPPSISPNQTLTLLNGFIIEWHKIEPISFLSATQMHGVSSPSHVQYQWKFPIFRFVFVIHLNFSKFDMHKMFQKAKRPFILLHSLEHQTNIVRLILILHNCQKQRKLYWIFPVGNKCVLDKFLRIFRAIMENLTLETIKHLAGLIKIHK